MEVAQLFSNFHVHYGTGSCFTLRDFLLSQRYLWIFQSYGIWRRVNLYIGGNVSE